MRPVAEVYHNLVKNSTKFDGVPSISYADWINNSYMSSHETMDLNTRIAYELWLAENHPNPF